MDSKLKHIDYTAYTFEDFLQDEFFVSSMKHPSKETEIFWTAFEQSAPSSLKDYQAAREYINTVREETDLLSEDDIAGLWSRIEVTNLTNERVKRKKYFLVGFSVAASVAILFGSFFFLKNYMENVQPDITTFALQVKAKLPVTNETMLILSKDKIVNIKDKESEITYDSLAIKTEDENIAKEKVATYNQLVIPRGKRSMLTFSDGSKVWVNAGTRVVYPAEFEKDKREIYVDGEIYIEVAKDANRPFYVRTKDMNVRVLGTKFNVTAYESESVRDVVLVEGRVQVETKQTSEAILTPNQMFHSANGKENIEQVDVDQYVSWVRGLYSFNSADLGLILKRLSDYYGVNVECNPALIRIKCSGKIDLKDDFETVIKGLTFVVPISYKYDPQNSTYHIERK